MGIILTSKCEYFRGHLLKMRQKENEEEKLLQCDFKVSYACHTKMYFTRHLQFSNDCIHRVHLVG